MPQIFSVVPSGEHWAVNSRLAGVVYRFRDRETAVDFARRLAERAPPATVEVRDEQGNVVEELSF
jgi:hypothetical protein